MIGDHLVCYASGWPAMQSAAGCDVEHSLIAIRVRFLYIILVTPWARGAKGQVSREGEVLT